MKYTIIAIVVVIAICVAVAVAVLKKKISQEIIIAIESGDNKKFNSLLEKKITKFVFPAAYLDSLRLNEAMIRNDVNEIDKLLEKLQKVKLSETDKEKIYTQAYNYYLSVKSYKKCGIWHDKIHELKNDRIINEIDKSYDIYVEKGYKYLDEMLDELEYIDPQNRGVNEFLISLMYKNKNDKENAAKYEKLSREHLKQFDEMNKQK